MEQRGRHGVRPPLPHRHFNVVIIPRCVRMRVVKPPCDCNAVSAKKIIGSMTRTCLLTSCMFLLCPDPVFQGRVFCPTRQKGSVYLVGQKTRLGWGPRGPDLDIPGVVAAATSLLVRLIISVHARQRWRQASLLRLTAFMSSIFTF